MISKRNRRFLVSAFWVVGAALLSQGIYLDAKAKVAQVLIAMSWGGSSEQRADDRLPPKPWWWADTRAIAKVSVKRLNEHRYVMQDDSGESLAFGPGHLPESAKPAKNGHVMIAGHRDSHFSFLKSIKLGDVISTQNHLGQTKEYHVTRLHVINTNEYHLRLSDDNRLTLITCYPFEDFVPGGPLRFLVEADLSKAQSKQSIDQL